MVRTFDGSIAPPLQWDASGGPGNAGELCRLAGRGEAAGLSVGRQHQARALWARASSYTGVGLQEAEV